MERSGASLARELRRWAAEEMRLPPGKVPSESAARSMCSGQCAEIWKYVIRHVRHQRNVKKIRGNLLWYQQMEKAEGMRGDSESEKECRKQLVQGIARLRGELQQVDLQIESAQRELVANEVALETAQEKIRDAQRRILLLQAYSTRVAAERQQLRGREMQVQGRLEQLKEMERKAKAQMVFGGKAYLSGFPTLEPEVLRNVQEACQLRFLFLKTLFEHGMSGNVGSEMTQEQLNTAYQHWLSTVEKMVGSHPPAHILSALEHLALQRTQKLQELTDSINISKDVAALKFRYDSVHLEDVSDPVDNLPSVQGLIKEGWSKCEMLCVQHLPLQAKGKSLSSDLETVVQEMHRLLSDGSERTILARAVFELELRAVRLRGYRDGLLTSCRELDEVVRSRHAELQGLQAKRQRILDFRRLVNEKQEHIRALIKGTSYIKSQLRKDQAEIQDFINKKLLPQAEQVAVVTRQLHNRVKQEVEQFGAVALPCLLRRELPGSQCVAAQELSIHRLNRAAPPKYLSFLNVCKGLAFPLYKAPEQLPFHVVELKQTLIGLQSQLASKRRALGNLQQQLDNTTEPDAQTLVREVQAHDQDQAHELLPRIQRVADECSHRIELWQELQAVMDAWWEQPAQFVLPHEQRLGFTLRQWLERWNRAARKLQQQRHSWA
ncbi:HAUS augmin-like complex subunit 5 [Tiliqua scincoides]|uniref:HAUS augmin-like complex subunit 5 n=1 Tax=Tiliqua scincoides TaxID=71010 RepID=UPI0034619C53